MSRRPPKAREPRDPEDSHRPRLRLVTGEAEASDAELVERCRGGEQAAAARLYRRHARRMAGIVHRLVGPDAVEDLLQDAFAEAFGSLSKLREPERFGSWLAIITIRKARRAVRRIISDPRERDALLESLTDVHATVPDEIVDAYRRLTLLRPRVYVAWMLRRVEGYTIAQTAELCSMGTSTVKRLVARGDQALEQIEAEDER